jgi:pyruvate formate lyase activating enzyme
MEKIASFFEKLNNSNVKCNLCMHRCIIAKEKRGICGVRENRNGELYTLVYGKVIAQNVDPIEKKPLYHFYPGSNAYSVGTVGCNFKCLNCQNFDISQKREILGIDYSPEDVLEEAESNVCTSIAYTYNEPTIFFEFMLDCAKLAKKNGIKNVMVTNGYITPEALKEIAPYIDAANIDLKFWKDESYKKIASANLQYVLDSIKLFYKLGIHIEITTLLIPEVNDSEEELAQIAKFIASIDKQIPWHVSAFHPMYKMMDKKKTSFDLLQKAYEIGRKNGLAYVYVGNVPGMSEDTFCPKCKKLLIQRFSYMILKNEILTKNTCECGQKIYISNQA